MRDAPPKPVRFGDLGLRLASGLALAAIAFIDVWMGGFWVATLVALALALMLWELNRMVTGCGASMGQGLSVLVVSGVVSVFATLLFGLGAGIAILLVGGGLVLVFERRHGLWLAGGLLYMGIALCALISMRHLEPDGILFVLWLVIVVVATDVGAYFFGRIIGGPRLWPRVSPGKTRSGALGGIALALCAGLPMGLVSGLGAVESILLSMGASIASQCGDLLESAVKRRFAVKDASHLIPGHGGVMDRLDGVIGAVWFVAICALCGLVTLE